MRREFTFLGRFVAVEEPDEWGAHHHIGEGHGEHGDDEVMLEIDGHEIMVHRLPTGDFHTHNMPFVRFSSVDDLAKAYVNYLEFGIDHGHSEKSE